MGHEQIAASEILVG